MQSKIQTNHSISMGGAIGLTTAYVALSVCVALFDIVLWRKVGGQAGIWLDFLTMVAGNVLFLWALQKTGCQIALFSRVTPQGVACAVGCAVLFYFLLDKCLDPIFESFFPMDEAAYQESLLALSRTPVISFLRVCIVAPIVEETLMRGCILGGLQQKYGGTIAWIVSSVLFAVLHFNMVQTASALVCGLVLGLLYLRTGSLLCCMIAHGLYNTISYVTTVVPKFVFP